MKLLTKELRDRLLENNSRAREADHMPVVKFFLPGTAMTWLFSEMEQDGDTLFGLADLGSGDPELGYSSLEEMESIRTRTGLTIERDTGFTATRTLSEYTALARASGSLLDIL